MVHIARFVMAALCCCLLVACAADDTTGAGYTVVQEATLQPGAPVPAPQEAVVLSLTGQITNTNVADGLDFDMATLEQLRLVEYVVDDPHTNRTATYQGVLLEDVLAVAGLSGEASELNAIALNDYRIAIPLDVTRWPVMIATREDGERMPVVNKGPIKVVFPANDFSIPAEPYNSMWVWQLRTIEVQ